MRAPAAGAWCLADGREVRAGEAGVAATDPALASGLGLVETFGVAGGAARDVSEHLDRLAASADRLEVPLPERPVLVDWLVRGAARVDSPRGWLKLVVTGGGRCLIYGGPIDPADRGAAASAVLLPWRRSLTDPLGGMKTLAGQAAQVLGLRHATGRGADEGVWLNSRGHVAEATTANLFVVRRGAVFTAGVGEAILPGITRAGVLALLKEAGRTVHEGKLRLPRLERADEAWLTSSVRGVRPLVRWEGRPVGRGQAGPLTRWLQQRLT